MLEFLIIGILAKVINANCPTGVFKYAPLERKLNVLEIQLGKARDVKSCGEQCIGINECLSFGYQPSSENCYLYNQTVWYGLGVDPHTETIPTIHYWKTHDFCNSSRGFSYNSTLNICYLYNQQGMTWIDGQTYCEANGGHLYMMDTPEKENFLKEKFMKETFSETDNPVVCLGSKISSMADIWKWFNGVNVTNFANGEPNGLHTEEKCAAIMGSYGLVDLHCENLLCSPLCELLLSPNSSLI